MATNKQFRSKNLQFQPIAYTAKRLHELFVEVNAPDLTLDLLPLGIHSRGVNNQSVIHLNDVF